MNMINLTKADEMITKFWGTSTVAIEAHKRDIKEAIMDMNFNKVDTGIANIYCGSGHGKYIPQIITCRLLDMTEEDFNARYEFEEYDDAMIEDFESLISDANDELQTILVKYKLLPEGYGMYFGYSDDGDIATMVYIIQ